MANNSANNELENKTVVVDMGAVRFVTNGADIMSPGIVEADDTIVPGDLVVIVDVNNKKPLAIGESLITGPEMVESSKGKAIKSLHYVGDEIWNLELQILFPFKNKLFNKEGHKWLI